MGVDASYVLTPGPWQHRMVAANGARFHVAVLGEGPLVLLLHGFPECWWAFSGALEPLAAAGYRAAAMDLRGYGASDKPPRGYDPETLARDVAGVVRSLGAREATLVGHGWGGTIAWTAAVLATDSVSRIAVLSSPHPRRLRTALLSSPAQMYASRHVGAFQRPILAERSLVAHDGRLVEQLLRAWAAESSRQNGWPDRTTAGYYRSAIRIPGVAHCSMESWRWAVRSIVRPDGLRFHRLLQRRVPVPVLQFHGEQDSAVLPASARGSSQWAGAGYRWELLPEAGHFPHEERPGDFLQRLLSWLGPPA